MMPSNREISENFAKGNLDFSSKYLADDVVWKVLGEEPIVGKNEVLEALKMSDLESFPVITIKNIVEERDIVVIESTGNGRTKDGKAYNQSYCELFHFKNNEIKEISTYLDTVLSKKSQS
jgi:uncharacterized protein